MPDDSQDLEARFFDLSIDMLAIARFTGYFKRLNPAWRRRSGSAGRSSCRSRCSTSSTPMTGARTLEQNRKVRAGGQALSFENRYVCKDGSYRWLLWNSTADPEHELIYAVARDITARKQAEEERERLVRELQVALAEVKELQTILPICMYCKSIRDDENYWQTVEAYMSQHTGTHFSHGICPACYERVSEDWLDEGKSE